MTLNKNLIATPALMMLAGVAQADTETGNPAKGETMLSNGCEFSELSGCRTRHGPDQQL